MGYVFALPETPTVTVVGTKDNFPVRRIYCVGQNYANHVREMGANPEREAPFFFSKPADAVCADGSKLPFPLATENLHHEVEMVVAIGKNGKNISESAAQDYVYAYAVGLDLTRRDLQAEAKKKGRPWATAKGFDNSAPCSTLHRVDEVGHISQGKITLSINGETRQEGDISELIWSVSEVISSLSAFFELFPGDLIYTGTPSGVGPLKRGDKLIAEIENLARLNIEIV
ncbi:MAG: fumarylacetoacetate hydrolase family protein [SAR324 cluster bacterium]|nr:fumarylacetoacetate hydrolase family protein [SAR324 cluster bacterium]MBL7035466.1 fumarylacetoacetate hydrolase family protein [SAR324 cluster bacterium]